MIAVREYTDAASMIADAKARRAMFFAPVAAPAPPPPSPRSVAPTPLIKLVPIRRAVFRERRASNIQQVWTAKEEKTLAKLKAEGKSIAAIATALRRTTGGVAKRARKICAPNPSIREASGTAIGTATSARDILALVASRFGFTPSDLTSRWRTVPISRARQEAMWLMARDTELSYTAIGRIFGRDHTTALHAIRTRNDQTGANVRGAGGVRLSRILNWEKVKAAKRAKA